MSAAAGTRRWALAARLSISAALLWLVSRRVDVGDVLTRLAELSPGWVVLGLAISVVQVAILAWRWRYTAARLGMQLPMGTALREYYLGILLNQVLPGGVTGDASRAWRHARSGGPAGPAVRAVILERASGQVVMTLVAVVSVSWLPWAAAGVRLAAVLAVLALFGLGLAWLVRRPSRDDSLAGRFREDARRAILAKEVLGAQLGSAVVVVASYIVVFLIAGRAVGSTAPLVSVLPLVAPVLMTMLIPVTVAGWGIREAAATTLWGLAGLTPEDGAVMSVTYGLLVLVSSAPGLLFLSGWPTGGRDRRARRPRG